MFLPRVLGCSAMQSAETTEAAEAAEAETAYLDQDSTPLVDALVEAAGNVRSPLFYPGHKMGRYVRRATCLRGTVT